MMSEEHELVRRAAREFAESRVEAVAKSMDMDQYPRDLIREAGGRQGILAPTVPPEHGGGLGTT